MLIKCSWYPKKKIGGNHTFSRDNKGSDLIKKAINCFVFWHFLEFVS